MSNYKQEASTTIAIKYDAATKNSYVEVNFPRGSIFPGSDVDSTKQTQILISGTGYDHTKDWSARGLSTVVSRLDNVCVYADGVLVFGTLPPVGSDPLPNPTPDPTPNPTPDPTPNPTPGVVNISLVSENKWSTGATLNYTIQNTSQNVLSGWKLAIKVAGGKVDTIWGMQSVSGAVYKTLDYNDNIKPGGSKSFGFNISHNGTYSVSLTLI
jgi:hypothetical protein